MTLLLKAKSFNKCIWVGFCVIVSILYLFMTANLGNLSVHNVPDPVCTDLYVHFISPF